MKDRQGVVLTVDPRGTSDAPSGLLLSVKWEDDALLAGRATYARTEDRPAETVPESRVSSCSAVVVLPSDLAEVRGELPTFGVNAAYLAELLGFVGGTVRLHVRDEMGPLLLLRSTESASPLEASVGALLMPCRL